MKQNRFQSLERLLLIARRISIQVMQIKLKVIQK